MPIFLEVYHVMINNYHDDEDKDANDDDDDDDDDDVMINIGKSLRLIRPAQLAGLPRNLI